MSNAPPQPFAGDFSYDFYLRLLRSSRERFALAPLRDYVPPAEADAPRLYVRHDIDVCLDAALRLAELEAGIGVAATYMFIPTSTLYDVASANGRARLRRIQELGHEVAIHFDVATSGIADPEDRETLVRRIDEQCASLSEITGSPVRSVSFHRPLPIFLKGPDRIGDRVNAYSVTLMEYYCSDSAGRWRSGNPLDHLPGSAARVAQLLTHPIWWGDGHQPPAQRLETFFQAQVNGIDPDACRSYDDLLRETVPGVVRAGAIQ